MLDAEGWNSCSGFRPKADPWILIHKTSTLNGRPIIPEVCGDDEQALRRWSGGVQSAHVNVQSVIGLSV
jgi:hypothetical protein